MDEALLDDSPKTSFREISRELHIPKVDLNHHKDTINFHRHSDATLYDAEETNELPLEPLKLNALRYYGDESNKILPDGSGVYTEGGLVYVSDSNKHQGNGNLRRICFQFLSTIIINVFRQLTAKWKLEIYSPICLALLDMKD